MNSLRVLCVLCGLVVSVFSLDREAFTFTRYSLKATVEPEQQRFAVRGTITLRNDSNAPQKNLSLQVSSTLNWRSIQSDGKPVQFVSQTYTSDIDHTGTLSEAIVSLPQDVLPNGTVELEVGYEGTIPLDATRLTRIDAPKDVAQHSDWDQISQSFTVVRGAGYVAWYPVAMESANLSEGSSLFETLGRWRSREAQASVKITLSYSPLPGDKAPIILCNGKSLQGATTNGTNQLAWAECSFEPLGLTTPAFAMADYDVLGQPSVQVYYLPGHKAAAESYEHSAGKVLPFVTGWFGVLRGNAAVAELPGRESAPFESGELLLTALSDDSRLAEVTLVHELTHAAFPSPRPWVYEGLAHFAQALYREQQDGRQAALDYLKSHRIALVEAEKAAPSPQKEESSASKTLITATSEEFYRSKAMYVWWMLRDMAGEPALKRALATYRADQDTQPSYVQRLIETQAKRDLQWFFDDWVYHDRGLPDFRVESVYPRQTSLGTFMATVTVENLGGAGAEVPVTVQFAGGGVTKRLEVRGKARASIRIETPSAPTQVILNDGSVPESDVTNNIFKVEVAPK